jgi:hypothetical protein
MGHACDPRARTIKQSHHNKMRNESLQSVVTTFTSLYLAQRLPGIDHSDVESTSVSETEADKDGVTGKEVESEATRMQDGELLKKECRRLQ